MTALFLISLALVTKHPSSGVNQQGLEIEHVMIEWNEQTGTPSVLYASIRGEDLSTKRKFDGIQFTVDIGFSAHPPAMRGGRPKSGRYLVVDGEKTYIPTIFVGSMRRVGEASDCNAKELAFSAISEIPKQGSERSQKGLV